MSTGATHRGRGQRAGHARRWIAAGFVPPTAFVTLYAVFAYGGPDAAWVPEDWQLLAYLYEVVVVALATFLGWGLVGGAAATWRRGRRAAGWFALGAVGLPSVLAVLGALTVAVLVVAL